jgi:oligosaccharide repeat unit polymerase
MIPVMVLSDQRRLDFFEPIVFKSVFMWMVIIALFDRVYLSDRYLLHENAIAFTFIDGFLLLCILYVVLFGSIVFGYYLSILPFEALGGILPSADQQNNSIIQKVAIVYILVGLVAYIATIGQAMQWDPLYLFTSSEPRSQVFASSTAATFRLLSQALYIGYFLYLTTIISRGRSPRLHHLLPFSGIVLLFALFGGRGMTIRIVLMLVVLLYYVWVKEYVAVRRNYVQFKRDHLNSVGKQFFLPIVALGIGGLTILARQLRRAMTLPEAIASIDFIRLLTFGIQNDKFDYFLALLSMDEVGYYFGSLYLRVIGNFIPRAIWPDKPVLTVGSELRRVLIPSQTGGRPPGEIGVYYANFSYPGIIILGVLCGLYLRISYEALNRNQGSPLAILLYGVVTIPIIVSGLTNNALWTVVTDLMWLLPAISLQYDWRLVSD